MHDCVSVDTKNYKHRHLQLHYFAYIIHLFILRNEKIFILFANHLVYRRVLKISVFYVTYHVL
jgi:hypothetical protein